MKKQILSALVSMGFVTSSFATGIPTVDLANLIPANSTAIAQIKQNVTQAKQYLKQLEDIKAQADQLVKLKEQLETAKDTFGSLNGVRDLSKLLNNPLLKEYRANLPTEWQEGFDLADSGLNDISTKGKEYNRLKSKVKFSKYLHGGDKLDAATAKLEAYTDFAEKSVQAETVARIAFDSSQQGYQNVETFIDEIDNAKDLKASADLTNRLLAENLAMQNKILQLQAAMAMQTSGQQNLQFEQDMLDRNMAAKESIDYSDLVFSSLEDLQ